MFSTLGYTILMLWICKKSFFSTIFLVVKVIRDVRQTWILIITSILFVIGTTILFSILGYVILMLWICKKSFLSTIFVIIKVHPWNEINLGTHNNLHSFCYWHGNHVLNIGLHDNEILDLQEKLSFHQFPCSQSLSVKWDKLGYP